MEVLFAAALLLPFALGGWVLAIVAYARAREADRRARRVEERVAALERKERGGAGDG